MPVNGTPLDTTAISDRGLAYGDGLFETILIHNRQLVLLPEHLLRLQAGARRLKITLDENQLQAEIADLSLPEKGVLKIILTRGSGGRGYRPGHDSLPNRIITVHPAPVYGDANPEKGIWVFVCQQRLSIQPALAGMKHLNRLEQVLASMEWPDDSFMEGLMLDTAGNVVEGTRSNLFWSEGDRLLTPTLDNCGVDGVLRQFLLKSLPEAEAVSDSPLERILNADQAFVCNSVFGIWPVRGIAYENRRVELTNTPATPDFSQQAMTVFQELLHAGNNA